MAHILVRVLLLVVLVLMAAPAAAGPVPATPLKEFRAASLEDDRIRFFITLYFRSRGQSTVDELFLRLCREAEFKFDTIGEPGSEDAAPQSFARGRFIDVKDAPPPTGDSLRYTGKGIGAPETELLGAANGCFSLSFGARRQEGLACLRAASRIALALADHVEGVLWDDECRLVYSRAEWKRRRVEGLAGPTVHAPDHVNVHVYPNGELLRAITLGMNKFGLPDVVIDQFTRHSTRPMGWLLNASIQLLIEGGGLASDGHIDIDLNRLKDPGLRESTLGSTKPNAQKRVILTVIEGSRDEGDPENRLMEITFPPTGTLTLQQRQNAALSALLGSEDAITHVDHDDAIRAASERARARLPELAARFRRGLAPGEMLLVKAPFDTPAGGREWMWVEVTRWESEAIEGILENDPFDIPDLKAGAKVQVKQSDLFDYLLRLPDGRTEGNVTADLISKQAK